MDSENRFERRLLFENFTIAGFKELRADLEDELRRSPTDTARYQLATVLAQCMPDQHSLARAEELLAGATGRGNDLPPSLRAAARDVQRSVRSMLLESESPSSGRLAQVNWGIYNRCPLVCVGCYNIFNSDQLSLREAKASVEKLARAGVEELVISGGDPLEWEGILPFVDHAYDCGLDVALDTVGYSFTAATAAALSGKVSYLGLPVDGSGQDMIADFRKGKNDLLVRVRGALELCGEFGIPVKVNTTVTKGNIDDLEDVAQLLCQYEAVVSWSLFQWWDLRRTPALRERMHVERDRFRERTLRLSLAYPSLGIWSQDVSRRARTHFFISANGEVYTFDSGSLSTIILGDIRAQSMSELIGSPALRKNSPKFSRSFPIPPVVKATLLANR
ncbi:radical SAM/SPASM domain-containing protein [Mycobacterium basiliense]|nr:radical SAM/SPASM domain-containing protein [Mycobacterium basiliense]